MSSVSNECIEAHLQQNPEVVYAKVTGDGYHFQLVVVSDAFLGKSKVLRQQWIYKQLKEFITSGSLHALSMKTLTQKEWEETHG